MLDVIIRGGRIADGSGRPAYRADVGLTRDTISHIGGLDGEKAKATIDAKGLVVSPGFVDVHTHSDITLLVNPKAESAVRQGVTTHVFPNCGMGLAPAVGEARKDVEERARQYGITVDWTTVGEYFRRVEAARPSINVIPMVAQGTVRMAVMGYSKDAAARAVCAPGSDMCPAVTRPSASSSTSRKWSSGTAVSMRRTCAAKATTATG